MGTRPEIYAMGFRNPFRMTVDAETGWVYVADYGPDASAGGPDARPGGLRGVEPGPRRRRTRLALLPREPVRLQRLRLRDGDVRRQIRLREPRQRLAGQHRPDPAAAVPGAGRLVLVRRLGRVPGARDRLRLPDGRARSTTTTPRSTPSASSRRTTTTRRSSSSGAATSSGSSSSTRAAICSTSFRSCRTRRSSLPWT